MSEKKEKPFDPEKYFGGEVIPSRSAEEIEAMKNAAWDRRMEELLGRVRLKPGVPKDEIVKNRQTTDIERQFSYLRDKGGKGEAVTNEDLEKLTEALVTAMLDPSEKVLTNTARGSISEKMFKILEEKYPELGFSINEEATNLEGGKAKGCVALEVTPYKGDKELAYRLLWHPIGRVLGMKTTSADELLPLGLDLEERGRLPVGTTRQALARAYINEVKELEEMSEEFRGTSSHTELINKNLKKLAELNVQPLRDTEIRRLLEKMIKGELEK